MGVIQGKIGSESGEAPDAAATGLLVGAIGSLTEDPDMVSDAAVTMVLDML